MRGSLLLTLAFFGVLAAGELVSTGVGLVRGRALTSREVQLQNLLELALFEKAPKDKLRLLAIDSKPFAKAVQDTLLESVIALEAQNFNLVQIPEGDLRAAEKQVLKALQGHPAWKTLQPSPKELEEAIKRKLQAKKFVEFRAQSSVLPVTDAEALKYFNENRLKFGNLPFENLKENIKSYLGRAQVERRLKDWYEVLLAKYQAKNLIAEI